MAPRRRRSCYGPKLAYKPLPASYDGIVVAVSHDDFRKLGAGGIRGYAKPNGLLFDVKGMLATDESDLRL